MAAHLAEVGQGGVGNARSGFFREHLCRGLHYPLSDHESVQKVIEIRRNQHAVCVFRVIAGSNFR